MNVDAGWRAQLLGLLEVARLGHQFPDSLRWRALLELLGREGPRGAPYVVALSEVSGLPLPRALAKLHKLQFVARAFLEQHRQRALPESRRFSMALAALELPPVSHTRVQLMRPGKVSRVVVTHERLELNAVRFSVTLDQKSGRHFAVGADQLPVPSAAFLQLMQRAGEGSATDAFKVLSEARGLEVVEVLRGQLGPFVSGLWPAPADGPVDVRALRGVVTKPEHAVLSVQLERLAGDVAKTTLLDPFVGDEAPVKGLNLARERRLFCTAEVEGPLKALLRGKSVLIRSR